MKKCERCLKVMTETNFCQQCLETMRKNMGIDIKKEQKMMKEALDEISVIQVIKAKRNKKKQNG